MNNPQGPRVLFFTLRERNWFERVLLALLGAAILVLGFFFLTVALIAGALLAAVIAVRWWWLARKLRREAGRDVVEGEYTVVERATRDRLPPHER